MFNRRYGYTGQSIVLTQEDYEIMAAADDRDTGLREMVQREDREFDEFARCLQFREAHENEHAYAKLARWYYIGGNGSFP